MIFAPGSTLWLLRHELRLAFRGLTSRRGRGSGRWGRLWLVAGLPLFVAVAAGVPLGFALRDVDVPLTPIFYLPAALALLMAFTLMLSQTLAQAIDALYQRGDLDLLFSSPLSPRRVMTVRFLGVAATVFATFAFFVAPVLVPVAILGHPAWLAALLVLFALSLGAAGTGLILAAALFRLIGPRRTRTLAQVMAALIGAAAFLASQVHNILGSGGSRSLGQEVMKLAADPRFAPPPGADWPLRALLGEPLPLLAAVVLGGGVFLAANAWLGPRFASDSAAAAGVGADRRKAKGGAAGFAAGPFAATLRKELRLLARDPALISQVLLRVLYMLPLGFVLLRQAADHQEYVLAGTAAALVLMSGQVAGSLAWITISAEDAPDLLACAPTPVSTLGRAKLAAAFIPVAVLLAPFLLPAIWLSPLAGISATIGCAAAALASGLLNLWWQKPGKRADFRRRRGASWFVTLADILISLLIGAAAGLFAMGWIWGLIPAALAALALWGLRRSDSQIAASLRTA